LKALHRAVRTGNLDIIQLLAEEGGCDVNKIDLRLEVDGYTPLMEAAHLGKEDFFFEVKNLGRKASLRCKIRASCKFVPFVTNVRILLIER
jgi:ankyrin repeat protein